MAAQNMLDLQLRRWEEEASIIMGQTIRLSFEIVNDHYITQVEFTRIVKQVVFEETGVTVEELDGRHKTDRICFGRYMCFSLINTHSTNWTIKFTFDSMGSAFNRDHSSAFVALKRHKDLIDTRPAYRALYSKCESRLMFALSLLTNKPTITP